MADRKLLLLGNTWKTLGRGMDNLNRAIALEFKEFANVQIFCTVLVHPENEIGKEDKEDASNNDVTLINTENCDVIYPDLNFDHMTEAFNQNPRAFLPKIGNDVPDVTHIIAHCPYTAEAGLTLRRIAYPKAAVILVNHIIPHELPWLSDQLPFYICPFNSMRQAEEADKVYSLAQTVHTHFSSVYRNHSGNKIDHQLLIPAGSQELFQLERKPQDKGQPPTILALSYGKESHLHDGLDIAACAVNKIAETLETTVNFVVGVYGEKEVVPQIESVVKKYTSSSKVEVHYHQYNHLKDLMSDLEACTLVIVPARCEPFSSPLIHIISAGVPTLVSTNSLCTSQLKDFVYNPDSFVVPVTNNINAVRQDASVWKDHIIVVLSDPGRAEDTALHLQGALQRNEAAKATYDDFKTDILGGIPLQVQVLDVEKLIGSSSQEAQQNRMAEQTLFWLLRHCVRIKHHPIAKEEDIDSILPFGHNVPISNISDKVIALFEAMDRRIISFDEKNKKMTIFCPTADALSDLWASCDVINRALEGILAEDTFLQILEATAIKTRVFISGVEFLKYKKTLVQTQVLTMTENSE